MLPQCLVKAAAGYGLPPSRSFCFLLWASRRLYCHNSNNNKKRNRKNFNFCATRGSGTCQPRGHPRAFASYVHLYPNITKHGWFRWKHKNIRRLAHLPRTEKLREFLRYVFIAYQARSRELSTWIDTFSLVMEWNSSWSRIWICFKGCDDISNSTMIYIFSITSNTAHC